jgi:hypothetical protein
MCDQVFTTDLIVSANIDELSSILNTFKQLKNELKERFGLICSPEEHEYACGGNDILVKALPLERNVITTSVGKGMSEVAVIRIQAVHPETLVKVNTLVYSLLKENGLKSRRGA